MFVLYYNYSDDDSHELQIVKTSPSRTKLEKYKEKLEKSSREYEEKLKEIDEQSRRKWAEDKNKVRQYLENNRQYLREFRPYASALDTKKDWHISNGDDDGENESVFSNKLIASGIPEEIQQTLISFQPPKPFKYISSYTGQPYSPNVIEQRENEIIDLVCRSYDYLFYDPEANKSQLSKILFLDQLKEPILKLEKMSADIYPEQPDNYYATGTLFIEEVEEI